MGFGKALKKVVKQASSTIKTGITKPFSEEGFKANLATFGFGLTGAALMGRETEKKEARKQQAERDKEAELEERNVQTYGFKNAVELAKARKKKEEELAGREETRATGIGSLIGQGKTLG